MTTSPSPQRSPVSFMFPSRPAPDAAWSRAARACSCPPLRSPPRAFCRASRLCGKTGSQVRPRCSSSILLSHDERRLSRLQRRRPLLSTERSSPSVTTSSAMSVSPAPAGFFPREARHGADVVETCRVDEHARTESVNFHGLYTGSVVVPAVSETMAVSCPVMALMREDLPALRLP